MSNYDAIVQSLQLLCEVPLNNSDDTFQGILPTVFEYADNRIYRELDMDTTRVATISGSAFTVGDGRMSVPTQFTAAPQWVNLVSPGATAGDAGTRTPLERISAEAMDYFFPLNGTSGTATPAKYAWYGTSAGGAFTSTGTLTMRVAPAPVTAYVAEFVGPVRPSVFSQTNPNTILTTRYPDLYKACCMVYLMGYQRDPDAVGKWEEVYSKLREAVIVEIARQKSESVGWSMHTPSVLANQPRDRVPAGGGG